MEGGSGSGAETNEKDVELTVHRRMRHKPVVLRDFFGQLGFSGLYDGQIGKLRRRQTQPPGASRWPWKASCRLEIGVLQGIWGNVDVGESQ